MPRASLNGENSDGENWLDAILHETTIQELRNAIAAGELTSLQATRWYLERIDAHDQRGVTLNAITTINPAAEDEARSRDREMKTGKPLGVLHGIPIVIKDNIDVAGMPTTGGCKALGALVPRESAAVVRHLRQAGAVILGKTNMSELAWGSEDTLGSFLPGFTRNPYNTVYACGGSSGGTAVAVSANLATAGIGTDTTCSVRAPASINALVGLRPTFGLVSCHGVMPLSKEWDTVGPLTRSVADAAILLEAMRGSDERSSATGAVPPRLGVPRALICKDSADGEVLMAFDAAMEAFRVAGTVTSDPVAVPEFADLDAAMWFRRFRHDFDSYLASHGAHSPHASLTSILASGEVHPWYRATLEEQNEIDEVPSENPYRDEMDHMKVKMRKHFLKAMDDGGLDALTFPTFCHPPRRNGDLLAPSGDCNAFAACTGFPALTVPMGFTKGGLPLGLQLLGRPWSEQHLLQIARIFEASTHHRRPPPV